MIVNSGLLYFFKNSKFLFLMIPIILFLIRFLILSPIDIVILILIYCSVKFLQKFSIINDSKFNLSPEFLDAYTVTFANNNHDCIPVNLDIRSGDQTLNMLIDTGASLSILKKSCIDGETICFPQNKCKIKGISNDVVYTLAKCTGNIILENGDKISQNFQIVPDDFPIPCNGILGKDFLKANKCIINYSKNSLELLSNDYIGSFNLRTCNDSSNSILVPARSEKLINLSFDLKPNGEYFCESLEIIEGIFLANSLIKIENNVAYTSIINATEKDYILKTNSVNIVSLDSYDVFKLYDWDDSIENRLAKLESIISTKHMNTEESTSILQICRDYNDVFLLEGDKLTSTDKITHSISTPPNVKPIYIKPYRLPEASKQDVNLELDKMLKDDIIKPSHSPWNFPLLIVPKKSDNTEKKRWRIVIDFRKLNEITTDDVFPLPNIVDILDQLGRSQYFTTLDMANGYHQVLLNSSDCEKTAFSTPSGHFEFVRMPQGLKGAPATFQRLMNMVLSGLSGLKCLVYLDDIIVYGSNLNDHNVKLIDIFKCLRRNNLKLNPNKCNFLRKEVIFLGHVVSNNGVLPDPKKIDAVLNYPIPKNVKDIKSFLGFTGYYRRFIPNYSHFSNSLNKLLKKGAEFKWDAFCDESFHHLKKALVTSPILQFPNFNREFFLTCDASDVALGAVLSQEFENVNLPIAYASRTINAAEKNYSAVEKELLAIVWSINQFRPYLFGRHFVVYTDHKPLLWLWNIKNPSSRLMRWRLKLEEYNFDIRHTPGKFNYTADALSRINIDNVNVITRSASKNLNNESTNSCESTDQENSDCENVIDSKNIVELKTENEINSAISQFHDGSLGGHQGINRTFNRMKNVFKFTNMFNRIKEYIKSCKSCQINKPGRSSKMPMAITSTSSRPFEKIALDIVGPIHPISVRNNNCILTLQDDLTKYSVAVPLPNQESETIAQAFIEYFICIYGAPESILTDQGSNFQSELFKSIVKLLKAKQIKTSPYHPQTNGALEKSHLSLANYLRSYTENDQLNWDTWVPFAMFCYNTTPHSVTKFTPYELVFGHKPSIPHSFMKSPEPLYNYDDYMKEFKYRMQISHKLAKENISNSKSISKNYYDKSLNPVKFDSNDLVLLKNENKKGKLAPLWLGPYKVVQSISKENTVVQVGKLRKTVHNNRLKHFIN